MFNNAQVKANVPYMLDPDPDRHDSLLEKRIRANMELEDRNERPIHKTCLCLDAGDYVEVIECGGKCDCYLNLKGYGWVPFGHVEFTDDAARRTFHPKAKMESKDRS